MRKRLVVGNVIAVLVLLVGLGLLAGSATGPRFVYESTHEFTDRYVGLRIEGLTCIVQNGQTFFRGTLINASETCWRQVTLSFELGQGMRVGCISSSIEVASLFPQGFQYRFEVVGSEPPSGLWTVYIYMSAR
jgi:hypothetical protein